ncbi:MAG: terpene cyclase/mutase family protein [Planctomycetaceae bacterium]|nr:terpene cyclase/mutase family protein [Planctomycetaceae bacterium]
MKRVLIPLFIFLMISSVFAADQEAKRREMIEKGVAFLRNAQAQDGSFSSHAGIGPTGIVLLGLLSAGVPADDPMIARGLSFLEKSKWEDGGIYTEGGLYGNYESCIALQCFTIANRKLKAAKNLDKGPYEELLANCERFVRVGQFTEQRDIQSDDMFYGGAGYGKHQRPDLSNTHFFIEALKSTGAGNDDPAIQKALVFVSRTQNLESQHNTAQFAAKNSDGGFIYTPVGKGESFAGETDNGGLRSYASMTYAGLKSMIYAGLTPEDFRVKAAYDWIRKHYDTESNPGIGDSGLFYYYTTFSKTLNVLKLETLDSPDGNEKHDWRGDLIESLAKRQQPNGSWINENPRWLEGDPNLVTGYALIALADCE